MLLKEVSIEIIRKCPNQCIHCSSRSDEGCLEILHFDSFINVVQDAKKMGANIICLSGGEPFLHKRIVDMIYYVASIGLQVYVYTSGIVFDETMQKTALNKDILSSISSKVSKLIFNIEAATSYTYDKIMGTNNCFEKMKQSVRNANNYNIVTEAHFVPMKLNIAEVNGVVDLCEKLAISRLSFLRLVLHGRAQDNASVIALSDNELATFKTYLNTLKEQSALQIRVGVPLSSCQKCEAAKGKLNINYDGYVFPCEAFKNELVLDYKHPENIYDKPLFNIYHESEYLRNVRKLSNVFACNGSYETCIGQHIIKEKAL